jgi:putative (di)nucleoside polyphosphate hydrolase
VTYHAQPEQGGRDPSLYRPNVGLAIFSKKGHLWLGRRAGVRKDDVRYAWQMPQGGIDRGETPAIAALRELGEETGINTKHVELLEELEPWLFYDFPPALKAEAHRPLFRPAPEMVRLPLHRLRHGFPPRRPHTGIRRLEMGRTRRRRAGLVIPFKAAVYAEVAKRFAKWTAGA